MVNDIMAKNIHTFWRLVLGSFITLLGFAACKTTKKAQQEREAIVLYGAPPTKVEKLTPIDQVKPLYAVPAVRIEKTPESKDKE